MMNEVLKTIEKRKSVRVYEKRGIEPDVKDAILQAAIEAPTAGNMMLYSIIDITEQSIKDQLAETCDHQPFIAAAPMLLLIAADYQRSYDAFSEALDSAAEKPGAGMMLLSISDALIAAQNMVIAAESMGVGSCYIGDIIENYETHRELFGLPDYVLPIALLCFGYPTEQQKNREKPKRFDRRFIVHQNVYNKVTADNRREMYCTHTEDAYIQKLTALYERKIISDFAKEMNRSSKRMIETWLK